MITQQTEQRRVLEGLSLRKIFLDNVRFEDLEGQVKGGDVLQLDTSNVELITHFDSSAFCTYYLSTIRRSSPSRITYSTYQTEKRDSSEFVDLVETNSKEIEHTNPKYHQYNRMLKGVKR